MPAMLKKQQASVMVQKKKNATRFIKATKVAGYQTFRMGKFVVVSLERIGEGVENITAGAP